MAARQHERVLYELGSREGLRVLLARAEYRLSGNQASLYQTEVRELTCDERSNSVHKDPCCEFLT